MTTEPKPSRTLTVIQNAALKRMKALLKRIEPLQKEVDQLQAIIDAGNPTEKEAQ